MNKIKIFNIRKCTAIFMAMLMMLLSLSYTGNTTNALNTRRQYYIYNAKTGVKTGEYYLDPVPALNNSRTIIGDNDERVIDWTKSGVVKLITYMGNICKLGSGFVVSDHVIATAAHCVYGAKISEIILFDNNGNITLRATPVEYHMPYTYVSSNQENERFDYALITVKEDLSDYAYFDLGVPLDSFASKHSAVSITGFPTTIGKPSEEKTVNTTTQHMMYTGNGTVKNIDHSDLMYYDCDTIGGNSGGPVYIKESFNGKTYYTVIAIHAHGIHNGVVGHNCGNHGACMTTDLIHFYTGNNTNINW